MEYRRNWDKLSYDKHYVIEHSHEDITDYSTITEPVSAAELKNFLRIGGYAGVDALEDALLESIISEARQRLESVSGALFIPHTFYVSFSSYYGSYYKLPYAPETIVSVTDWDTVAATYTLNQRSIEATGDFYLTYTAKYLPEELTKMPVMRMAAYLYQHRGDEDDLIISKKANDISAHLNNKSWLL